MRRQDIKEYGLAAIAVFSVLLAIILISNHHTQYPKEKDPPANLLPKVQQSFRAPNRNQLRTENHFYAGDVDVQLFIANSSYDEHKQPKSYGFYVWYDNLLNKPVSYPAESQLNIGCIAKGDQKFQDDSTIFANGGFDSVPKEAPTSLAAAQTNGQLVLGAYELKKVQFTVSGQCQYVGTQDGEYWWDVPGVE